MPPKMNELSFASREAIRSAKNLLSSLNIRNPDEIEIDLISAHYGASVTYRPLSNEEGHLLRAADTGLIVVDEQARRSEKWRFVIAHELGHFICHRDLDQLQLCTDTNLNDWYRSSGHETDANFFAAEILMPEVLFAPLCDRSKPSINDVRELASLFRTSLTSTAIRLIAFCPEPCAVVCSTKGMVDWAFKTQDFAGFIRKGQRLTDATYAGDLFAGKPVDDRQQLVDGAGWGMRRDVYEHSLKLGGYDSVLTVLWHPDDR